MPRSTALALLPRAPPRATNDTDIAGTLNNWDHFEAIRATFRALGSTGHRFLIADRAVDALPFGEVESPTGTTRHPQATSS